MTTATPIGDFRGPRPVHRHRFRNTVIVSAAVVSVLLVLFAALNVVGEGYDDIAEQERLEVVESATAMEAEFDAWVLPATVVEVGNPERSDVPRLMATEARTDAPATGASAEAARADLVAMLRSRGWEFGWFPDDPWSAFDAELGATLRLTVQDELLRIEMSSL